MISKSKVIGGLAWKFFERSAYQIINFAVTMILARLLSPDEYGMIAIVIAIIAILQVFVDSGMGIALVQKRKVTDTDFSTVFFVNISVAILLYSVIFGAAPLISEFYAKNLTNIIRILSLMIIIFAVKNIFQSYMIRNMLFRKAFIASIAGIITGGIFGITFAYKGFGVWALVSQQLICELVCALLLAILIKWKPGCQFSWNSFNAVFSFGWKLLVSSLIDTIFNNIRQLLIGKFYSSGDLAYYSKGEQFPNVIVSNINTSMNTVLLPVMSQHQDSKPQVKNAARKIIRTSSYLIWPMMVGLCVVAEKLVVLLLTKEWIGIVPYIRIFCFMYALQSIQTTNLNVMKSLGRTDLCLKLEVIKKCVGLFIIIISLHFGVLFVAVGSLIYAVIASMINAYPNKKLIDYSYIEQLKDILPFILISAAMGIPVYFVGNIPVQLMSVLIIQIIVGIMIYLLLSWLFKIDCFFELLSIVRKAGKERRNNR